MTRHAALIAVSFVSGLFGCAVNSNSPQLIDQNFVDNLRSSDVSEIFDVNSGGGDPVYGEKASKYIIDKQMSIRLGRFCLSACAEYILPSAKTIIVAPETLIGFHQNPAMIRSFAVQSGYDEKPICHYGDEVGYINALHRKNSNGEYPWETVLRKIVLIRTKFSESHTCVEVGFKFQHEMWFPTSEQIRDLFGVEFKGSICADNPDCIQIAVNTIFTAGRTAIAGDRVYTSTKVTQAPVIK